MSNVAHCTKCGATLPTGILGNRCPRCLVQLALDTPADPAAPAQATAPTESPLGRGQSFGDYELLEVIARGGMGIVYKARQKSLNRIVAVKLMLSSGQLAQPEVVQRFRTEAQAVAHLQHPNIVAIYEVGEHDGQHYFSMEYVEGRTLAEMVRDGPLAATRAATYLKTISEAVQYAHAHGILHRDLKPSNVLIDSSDQPRITDFGLAKRLENSHLSTFNPQLTLSGQVLGSPNYLSPEQAAGRQAEVGPASDVYALGAMLYHLLTGRPPFQGDSLTTLLRQVIETDPIGPRLLNPGIPRDLETICLKCLEKDRSRRFGTAQALADELGRFLRKEPILARPVSRPEKVWRWCRRKPALATALGTVVLVAAVGFAGILTQWQRAEEQRRQADEQRRLADEQRRNAEYSELFARQNAYAADMSLAQRALEANDVRLAISLLDKYRPGGKAESRKQKAEIDLRGWEWRYLWQLYQPDTSVRLQTNSGSLGQMAISHDGKVMAVQTGADKIALWDLTTKRQITELPRSASVEVLALSPTGNRLAVSSTNALGKPTVEVWDVNGPALRTTLNQPAPVRALAFSPDEALLASFGNEGDIAVVEWATPHPLTNFFVLPPRQSYAGLVAFSPDGSRLAIGEDYGRVNLLDLRSLGMVTITNLSRAADAVSALAFAPTADLLAAYDPTSGTIRLWDASGASRGQLGNLTPWVSALAFSPDSRRLAAACEDRTIRVWSVADQDGVHRLRGHEAEGQALAFLDGQTLVSGCKVGTACFWDLRVTNRPSAHTSLEISRGRGAQGGLDRKSFRRETLDPKVVRRFGFTFTPDGQSFITTDPNGSLAVWDTRSVKRKESLPDQGSNNWGVALSPDGHWLATGDVSGKVNVWDWAHQRRAVTNFALPFEWFGYLCFSRSGRFLWAMVMFNKDGATQFKMWRTQDWQEVSLAGVQVADIYSADFSPDDRFLATGHANGAVKLWNFPSGRPETPFTNHAGEVLAVLFSPDGRMLASTSFDRTVKLRDLFAHREVATLWGHTGSVGGAALSPDGQRLVTGGVGSKDAVRLWDLTTQRELLYLQGEGELLFLHVAFSPDGSTIMAVSFAGIAHLWRAPSWAEIEAAEEGQVAP